MARFVLNIFYFSSNENERSKKVLCKVLWDVLMRQLTINNAGSSDFQVKCI